MATCESGLPDVTGARERSPIVEPSYGVPRWDVGHAHPTGKNNCSRRIDYHPSHGPVAIGEIGLDRWILDRARPGRFRLIGRRARRGGAGRRGFSRQLDTSRRSQSPYVIHCPMVRSPARCPARRADAGARIFLHAYSGSAESAKVSRPRRLFFVQRAQFLEAAQAAARELYAALPADRLLVRNRAPDADAGRR